MSWWPEDPKDWPALDDTFEIEGYVYRHQTEEALAILLLAEVVVWLPGMDQPFLAVGCNDTFAWACADAEPLPWTEGCPHHANHDELWKLYDAVRASGPLGGVVWCVDRRKQRPIVQVVDELKRVGLWTDEMDRLGGES